MQPTTIMESPAAIHVGGLQGRPLPTKDEGMLRVQVQEVDGWYIARILNEPDLPHHGDGPTDLEALEMLCDVLGASWEGLCEAPRLSSGMARRKARLDRLFGAHWTE
jgi:hypothetical protein